MFLMQKIWGYIKKNWTSYILIAVLLLIVDTAQLCMPYLMRRSINLVEGINTGKVYSFVYQYLVINNKTHSNVTSLPVRDLYSFALYYLLFAILVVVGRFVYMYFVRKNALSFEYKTQTSLFDKYLTLPDSFFHNHEIGDLMSRANNDTVSIRRFMVMGLIAGFDIFFLGTASLLLMLFLSPLLTSIVLIPLGLLIILTKFMSARIHAIYKKIQDTFGEITTRVRESLIGMNVIRTFGREKFYLGLFSKTCSRYMTLNMSLAKLMGLFHPAITWIVTFVTLLVFLIGGRLVILGKMDLGVLLQFSQYISMLSWPMMAFGFVVNMLQRASISMGRIDEIMTIPSIIDTQLINKEPDLLTHQITIKNLSYAYPDETTKNILSHLDLSIGQSEVIGITGPTGSGKTTLISLILRIWEPPKKTIYMGDHDIADLNIDFLHQQIAYVPQVSFLFSATVRENLIFGNVKASQEEIENVINISCMRQDIEAMDKGLDTLVGERGLTLSGGQKQRLCFARAILSNRSILVMDDSLSAVDPETEEKITQQLKKHCTLHHLTCILISHRISALSWANRIAVVKHGKIDEIGSHDELVSKEQGYYYNLYKMQYLEGLKGLNHGN
jgi:ATP-binding cassette subfamily B multidrug efflux pump